jgi:hypothetical protein
MIILYYAYVYNIYIYIYICVWASSAASVTGATDGAASVAMHASVVGIGVGDSVGTATVGIGVGDGVGTATVGICVDEDAADALPKLLPAVARQISDNIYVVDLLSSVVGHRPPSAPRW